MLTSAYLLITAADIESLWWLCLWCITYVCANDFNPTTACTAVLAESLFPVRNHYARLFVLRDGIPGKVHFTEKQALQVLDEWGLFLWALYEQVETNDGMVNDDVTKNVHVLQFVNRLYDLVSDAPVVLITSPMPCSFIVKYTHSHGSL